MNEITAPYGFVPLSEKVVLPEWVQPRRREDGVWTAPPVQDVPFEDGIRGSLLLEIEAETPIFTRGSTGDGTECFRLPDGRFALPGTLLRGAIRNIVEIVSFGRMGGRVNDHHYAVRDLQNRRLYGDFMADIVRNPETNKKEPMPLVNAGWLERVDGPDEEKARYRIRVCDFAKIEYRILEDLARRAGIGRFRPGEKQSAVKKYEAWGSASREVQVRVRFQRPATVNRRSMPSRYGKVEATSEGARGTLVFTGQPSSWTPDRRGDRRRGSAKHHDFVFLDAPRAPILDVRAEVFAGFEFGHSAEGPQHSRNRSEEPNEEWGHWKRRLASGERVPVFFLASDDGGAVQSFGLAMMFRLPYKHGIGKAVEHAQGKWPGDGPPRLDLADGLFGAVLDPGGGDLPEAESERERRGVLALKGRVDFSHAMAEGRPSPGEPVRAVLGAPKASYYPNYVEQDTRAPGSSPPPGTDGKPHYKTWQDDGCRPRGWKRYRPMERTWLPEPPTGADGRTLLLDRVASTFRPLPAGTTFRGTAYLHNVRPVELGALLWALELGADPAARHALGMARPLGYGRCRMRVRAGADLRDVREATVDLAACRSAFEAYMSQQVAGWAESAEIQELLALARPVAPDRARYQRLDPGRRINEFVDAKKEGLALPSASGARRAAAATSQAAPGWPAGAVPLHQKGDVVRVRLVDLSRKGKWRSQLVGSHVRGTIEGTPPEDAAAGQEHDVEVIGNADPKNLNLRWP